MRNFQPVFIVRSDADLERAICLASNFESTLKVKSVIVFIGDKNIFFEYSINNKFLTHLILKWEIPLYDISSFSIILRFLKWFFSLFASKQKSYFRVIKILILAAVRKYINLKILIISHRILKKYKPTHLFTDQTIDDDTYPIARIRKYFVKNNIKTMLFCHGAAGGLHKGFANYKYSEYNGCLVLAPNKLEVGEHKNRIVTGDFSYSKEYLDKIYSIDYDEIEFNNNCDFRIAIIIGGTLQSNTITNSWRIQEEIIINLSNRKDVAIVLKLHPREAELMDLRMVKTFKNVKIVRSETDRSRVIKWSNHVICSDHTSIVFDVLIRNKSITITKGYRIPRYRDIPSPFDGLRFKLISNAEDFELTSKVNYTFAPSLYELVWGDKDEINPFEKLMKIL